MPLIKWEILATPNLLGGWGLKKIHFFSKSIAVKVGWRLITTKILWIKLVTQKYICWNFVEEWIKRPIKDALNCTIIWKSLIKSFSLVG
jgi:hypothetical protein